MPLQELWAPTLPVKRPSWGGTPKERDPHTALAVAVPGVSLLAGAPDPGEPGCILSALESRRQLCVSRAGEGALCSTVALERGDKVASAASHGKQDGFYLVLYFCAAVS